MVRFFVDFFIFLFIFLVIFVLVSFRKGEDEGLIVVYLFVNKILWYI